MTELDLDAVRTRAGAGVAAVNGVSLPIDVILALADLPALVAEVERLRRWKAEAAEVLVGLQDVGEALGLPLGTRITGSASAEKARALAAQVERVRAVVDALDIARAEGRIQTYGQIQRELRAALDPSTDGTFTTTREESPS